ncbi:MAG: VPLPA-CTERM sorting domain-containing protein [Methylomonas sp.]|nr:VPLPA-CTERM sorting domain-containing protein [Methylomonas sp.]
MTTPCSSKLIIPIISGSLLLLANSTAKAADAYLMYSYSGGAGAQPSGGTLFSSPGSAVTIYSNQTQFLADSASDSAAGDLPNITFPDYVGPTTSTQSATAAIQGSFNFNYLSARASSSAAKTVGRYTWSTSDPRVPGPQEAYNDNYAGGSAGVSQTLSDQLTIVSTELQIGAPVELVVDWSLDALLSITGAQSDAFDNASITMEVSTLLGGAPRQQFDYWNNGAEAHSSGSFTVEAIVGQVIPFGAQLSALTTSYALNTNVFGGPNISSFADATANFALRVITPGAGYSAASGNVYATSLAAVPVPSAAWLFASGLLGLFGLKRRR